MNRKGALYKTRSFELDVKSVAESGIFTGYGSVFGVVDSYSEVVAPGAFKNSLAQLAAKGRSLPILWQHRTGEPIGAWTSLKEDGHGLLGDGELWLDDAQYARIAYKGMQSKSITGLSIGYYVIKSSYNEKTGIRTLEELDLVEVSIVTVPANDEARIDSIKSRIAHGSLPDMPDFEKFLHEAGFSKHQAAQIANRGLKQLLQNEPDNDSASELAALLQHTSNFSLPIL
ncbi:peptidase U35 [Massilia sp. Root351]|uniref:HK97 family phage prohead protease n=1 Tax=Massilia sp. Root351 TaxID=1736522 RepID=UPI00070AC213|nr:HK97 family phage prohead protease [Massilia sp. Root351]KQV78481.1 peptidase U35 [Massilia sp. Root351]